MGRIGDVIGQIHQIQRQRAQRRLFGALCENALAEPPAVRARFDLFPLHRRAMLAASPDAQTKVRHVADYVAGMTDSFAMRMFARLFLPQQGTLFDVL